VGCQNVSQISGPSGGNESTVSRHVVSSEPCKDLIVYFHIHIRKLLKQWQDRLAPVSGRSELFTMPYREQDWNQARLCSKFALSYYLTRKLEAEWHWHEFVVPQMAFQYTFPYIVSSATQLMLWLEKRDSEEDHKKFKGAINILWEHMALIKFIHLRYCNDSCQSGLGICTQAIHENAFNNVPLQKRGLSQYLDQVRGRGEQRVKLYGSLAEGSQWVWSDALFQAHINGS